MLHADPRVVLGLHRSRHQRHTFEAALDAGITSLDTAHSYGDFTSHATLAARASDLLPRFTTLSTKVGFLPRGRHTLDPAALRKTIEESVRDLGREPTVILLHNPEQSLRKPEEERTRLNFAAACAALQDAASDGLCSTWGVTSWDPRPLVELGDLIGPVPPLLMVPAGLLVPIGVLDASDLLMDRWAVDADHRWGMSPFRRLPDARVWEQIDPRQFLRHGNGHTRLAAAFRVAYGLPDVAAVAVGSDDPEHIRDLVATLKTTPDTERLADYRDALRARMRSRPLPDSED
ncbi:hypothetical protein GCM10023205_12050 [Yinghuangia aomiensis]|uniref:NADP-dependent oxidoreductase domain-containing protein n=1 Tax=Yinghuangia aomiensis TaxID=676205 RepID=A0ABP9GTE1_9ACTN